MIFLTQAEADLYEATKNGLSFHECEIKFGMSSRSLTSAFQHLVTLNIVEREKIKTYRALPASYIIKSAQAVREQRKKLKEGTEYKCPSNLDQAAITYIAGHYHIMTRNRLLKKLKEEGYKINKSELNEVIIQNELDKHDRSRNSKLKIAL